MNSPKHISGLSAVHNGTLYVIFNYCTDFGFDPLGIVDDITSGGTAPSSITYSNEKVVIKYLNYTEPTGGFKTYNLTFASGYNTDIVVDVLGINRTIDASISNGHLGNAKDCSEDMGWLQSIGASRPLLQTHTYAAYPVADPGDVFSYPDLWERTATVEPTSFEGEYIAGVWANNGYIGGRPTGSTSALQHVRFITAIDTTIQELYALGVDPWAGGAGLFMSALYAPNTYKAVAAFDWALNLESCEISSQYTYDVCKDPGSPSYFETTGLDCDGNAIPALVLDGAINAIFEDCCACATDCLAVDATLIVTPATSIGIADGSFALTVSGGTANYTYLLTVPSGITYLGTANPPATSSATHTFTDIEGTSANASGIYTVRVTDTNGCFREFKIHMPGLQTGVVGCTNPTALNYNSAATIDDGSCVECTNAGLIINESLYGAFVSGVPSIVSNASTPNATDGSIEFIGSVNQYILPYLTPGNYNLTLYSTNVIGGALITPAIIGANGLSSPTHIFQSPDVSLASGTYAITTEHTGLSGCTSTYHFEIGYDEEATSCDVFIDYTVNCGILTVTYESENEVSIDNSWIAYQEQQYPIGGSVTVSPGETVYVTIGFESGEDCETYIETYVLGESLFTNTDCSGCTDPNASNWNPLATIDDGSCEFDITGCTDPLATNWDPSATVDDGSCYDACSEEIIDTITVTSNVPTITFENITTSYSVTWVNNETGASITTEDTATGPTLADGVYTVTVTDGNGCTEVDILGVNTTIVYGCMDIYADNYNPAANATDNNCNYSFVPSPCTPNEIEVTKTELDTCLSDKLGTFFNLMKAGRLTPCKERVTKVLVLLRYLLSRRGLECVYNCADSLSPTYSETPQGESCGTKWSDGGPTGESLVWDSTTVYAWGDVVQHPTSLDIYTMTLTPNQGPYIAGSDPETEAGLIFWEYCREPFAFADTTNRLDSYLAFIRDECKDCGIPGSTPIPPIVQENPDVSDPTTENGLIFTIDGENLDL